MVFATNFSALVMPRYVVALVLTLAYIRNVMRWLLSCLGLADQPSISGRNPPEMPSAISSSSMSACKIKNSLPLCKLASFSDGFSDDVMCAVCLSSVQKDDKIRQLFNCLHIFHRECLDKWIDNYQSSCPLCRSSLLPKEKDSCGNDG